MFVAALIVVNIPVYLFLGWLAFDSKADASRTFVDTTHVPCLHTASGGR